MEVIKLILCLFFSLYSLTLAVDGNNNLENIGEIIKTGIDHQENPCNDFYSYVCGSWKTNHEQYFKDGGWIQGQLTNKRFYSRVEEIFKTPVTFSDSDELKIEKKWISACMDAENRKTGFKNFQKIVKKNEEWPLVSKTPAKYIEDKMRQEVDKFYARLTGESTFFDTKLNYNKELEISNPSERDYYRRLINSEESFFENEMEKVLTAFNFDSSAKRKLLKSYEMIELKKLHDSFIKNMIRISPEYVTMTISELQKLTDEWFKYNEELKISWLESLNAILENTPIKLQSSDKVSVDSKYLRALCLLLKEISTPAVVNYIHWIFAFGSRAYEVPEVENANENRLEKCINDMPLKVGYISKLLKEPDVKENIELVDSMFKDIRSEFINEIKTSWLSSEAKEIVLNKLKGLKVKVGLPYEPEMIYDEKQISYDFKVEPDTFNNFINFKRAQVSKQFVNTVPNNRIKRDLDINAFYLPYRNYIRVTEGIPFIPLVNPKFSNAMKYGYLGYFLGHEMSHSLDLRAVMKDSIEQKKNWWSSETTEEYNKKAECFKQKFKNSGVDTTATLEENIADSVGIKLAYNAFKRGIANSITDNAGPVELENFNKDQLFFISFASYFCTHPIREYGEGEVYPEAPERVNQAVSSLDGFFQTFKCNDNSLLSKNIKCDLWN